MLHHPEGKAVVTGGAGFIGSHLVDRLIQDTSCDVVVLDNFHRGRRENLDAHRDEPRLRIVDGDIRDGATVDEVLRGASIVYHLAAQSTVMGAVRDDVYNFTTNVVGTFTVLRAASALGVKRVVFSSSREVYGDPIVLPVDEGHPLLPINSYGASKVAGEALCRAFSRERGLETIMLRLANAYGPRDIDRVIPRWLGEARAGEDLVVFGGGQVIDFIWVGDVVEAMVRSACVDTPLPPINVASGTGTKILDLARRIADLANTRSSVRVMAARTMEVTKYIGDPGRMTQILGVQPATDSLSRLGELIAPLAGAAA